MRSPGIPGRFRALAPIIGAVGSAAALIAFAPMAHAHIRTDCPASSTCPPPSPTPIPVNAFLSLDVTAGDPNTQITVNGGAFLPNESMTLFWDPPSNKVAGGANADSSGNFTTHVKPFSGDAPGPHRLCASVPPNPCAAFMLQALATTPTPQESPSPSPDTSPSPAASSTLGSPTPVAATINGLDVMLKPPFVILPIIGGAGLLIALIYWTLSVVLRPQHKVLKSVEVAHLASRPDYAAGFGTAPPAAPQPASTPSAWTDVPPTNAAAPPQAVPPEAQAFESTTTGESALSEPAASPPEAPPPDLTAAPDEPPDLPEPGDY